MIECNYDLPLLFQSTQSLRTATISTPGISRCDVISIHAVLADCDYPRLSYLKRNDYFNPRSPCGLRHYSTAEGVQYWTISIHAVLADCDCFIIISAAPDKEFQSTQSLRTATHCANAAPTVCSDFNPRSPCGLRHTAKSAKLECSIISIHAVLADCDHRDSLFVGENRNFNPRSPCGLRLLRLLHKQVPCNFNPRSPCGLRLRTRRLLQRTMKISIHAVLADCDITAFYYFYRYKRFQSTQSLRTATSPKWYC